MEQLAGEQYARDDVEDTYLGGGHAYMGTDGIAAGLYVEVLDTEPSKAYHHTCSAFADFVNTYHKKVVPAFDDIQEEADCDVRCGLSSVSGISQLPEGGPRVRKRSPCVPNGSR